MRMKKLSPQLFTGTNNMFRFYLNLPVTIFGFALLFILVVHAEAQTPGSLDLSFGNGGKIATDFNISSEQAKAIAVQSDGKTVIASQSAIAAGIVHLCFKKLKHSPGF